MSTSPWWRVHYHVWAPGGLLLPTWMEVRADDAEQAIRKAESECRNRYRDEGRSYCGHFQGAKAERSVRS